MYHPATEPVQSLRPFLIEDRRRDAIHGHFVPEARLIVTSALRESGLLSQLCDSEARALFALLTFLTADGRIRAAAWQVAEALQIPEKKAKERLDRLSAPTHLRPVPVLVRVPRESGMDVYALTPALLAHEQAPEITAAPQRSFASAGRAAVIAHSRLTYARPRAEAEREVEAQLGHATAQEGTDTSPLSELAARLVSFGVPRETALSLVAHHPAEEITRQLDWIGLRSVRTPSRFLVAAIRGRYDPPPGARRAIAAAELENRSEEVGEVSLLIPEAVDATAVAGKGEGDA